LDLNANNFADIDAKYLQDLFLLGLVNENKSLTTIGEEVLLANEGEQRVILKKNILNFPRVLVFKKVYEKCKTKKPIEISKMLPETYWNNLKESSRKIYTGRMISWLR
jgi:hypothetical protein